MKPNNCVYCGKPARFVSGDGFSPVCGRPDCRYVDREGIPLPNARRLYKHELNPKDQASKPEVK